MTKFSGEILPLLLSFYLGFVRHFFRMQDTTAVIKRGAQELGRPLTGEHDAINVGETAHLSVVTSSWLVCPSGDVILRTSFESTLSVPCSLIPSLESTD